jgi:hypothetical protein
MMGAMMGSGDMPGDGGGGFGGGGFGGGGFGGGGYGATEMESSGSMMPGDAAYGGYGMGQNSQNMLTDVNANDKPIEVLGVVYIYNPVDVRKLRLEEAAEAAVEAGPTAEPPAAGDTTAPTAGD